MNFPWGGSLPLRWEEQRFTAAKANPREARTLLRVVCVPCAQRDRRPSRRTHVRGDTASSAPQNRLVCGRHARQLARDCPVRRHFALLRRRFPPLRQRTRGHQHAGNALPVPAVPGPLGDPRKKDDAAHVDPMVSANPALKDQLATVVIQWHVHPSGSITEVTASPIQFLLSSSLRLPRTCARRTSQSTSSWVPGTSVSTSTTIRASSENR